jgi:hypothetical protein
MGKEVWIWDCMGWCYMASMVDKGGYEEMT